VAALFEGYEAGIAQRLTARHGPGSQYVSDYFQEELRFLGIESSPAFVREPEGKGVAERFIRTLKQQQFLFEARPRLGRVDPDALGGAVATTTKTVAVPSWRVTQLVTSIPHITSGRSVMRLP
jgi:hypothetical protein